MGKAGTAVKKTRGGAPVAPSTRDQRLSWSRLWQPQGKTGKARQLLAETDGWVTAGVETADLQEARVLVEELTGR